MRILKSIITIVVILSILFTFTSCKKSEQLQSEQKCIVDINGDRVTIPSDIEKVICRSGNGTSFMVAMGLGDKLVGTADYVITNPWGNIFYPGTSNLPSFGWAPSSEEIYAVGADLVMLADPEVARGLRNDGISALCYKQYNENEIIDSAKLMGRLFGEDSEEFVNKWIEYYNKTNTFISEALKNLEEEDKLNVYYIYGQSNKGLGRTDGGGSITQFWVEGAGGKFITKDLPNDGPKITEEEAIKRSPDVILIGGIYSNTLEKELLESPEWSAVPAVSEKRIYNIPIGFIAWDFYGVEYPLLKLWAAQQLYPNLINVDMHSATKEFYKEFYNTELTDEQIDYILKGLTPDGTEFASD